MLMDHKHGTRSLNHMNVSGIIFILRVILEEVLGLKLIIFISYAVILVRYLIIFIFYYR